VVRARSSYYMLTNTDRLARLHARPRLAPGIRSQVDPRREPAKPQNRKTSPGSESVKLKIGIRKAVRPVQYECQVADSARRPNKFKGSAARGTRQDVEIRNK
jgi:hypothetical protein